MTRLIIFISALLFLGFTETDKQCIDFLFYDLPLDKNTHTIKDKISQDKNFKLTGNERTFFHLRYVEAKIESPHTYMRFADSASINMNLLSSFYYGNKSQEDPILKELELTLYFKSSYLKNAEFDTLEKVLAKNYKLKHLVSHTIYSDGPNGKDTIPETGKRFLVSNKNKYPEIELSKNTIDKKHCYIKLIYKDVN